MSIEVKYNFLNTITQSASACQRAIDSREINKEHLVSRVIEASLSAITDVLIDTGKTPMQSLEHTQNAIIQLLYSRTSGEGYLYEQVSSSPHFLLPTSTYESVRNPSEYSIKGCLFYTECAVSHAIFTVPTTLLSPAKLVHQLVGHFFYESKTYSIGLAGIEENSLPAWDPISQSDARKKCDEWQNNLYTWTRSFIKSQKNPDRITPRILSPFIAGADVALDTAAPLTATIETVCKIAKHSCEALAGQEGCSLRGVIVRTDLACFEASQTASAVLMAVPKFLQKTSAILYDPEHAYSVRAFSNPENYSTVQIARIETQLRHV